MITKWEALVDMYGIAHTLIAKAKEQKYRVTAEQDDMEECI